MNELGMRRSKRSHILCCA